MIIETALVELAKAGGTELFISSSESLLKKVKTAKDIKQLFINTGEFFVDYENDADQLFDDMANVLSKENMTKLANELKDEPGYKLKDRLGRLFAYAPKTADGHYPCEAVCQIIEEYGDESLLSEYRCELFNKREIFSPSAGRAEKDIAEGYKDNAEFLSIKYPKTADVFFKMSQSYVYDSDLERRRAENGYF